MSRNTSDIPHCVQALSVWFLSFFLYLCAFSCLGSCPCRRWTSACGSRGQGSQSPAGHPEQSGKGWRSCQGPCLDPTSSGPSSLPGREGSSPEEWSRNTSLKKTNQTKQEPDASHRATGVMCWTDRDCGSLGVLRLMNGIQENPHFSDLIYLYDYLCWRSNMAQQEALNQPFRLNSWIDEFYYPTNVHEPGQYKLQKSPRSPCCNLIDFLEAEFLTYCNYEIMISEVLHGH